jgi:tetratricopeptide (TPR) repeat protein
LQYLYKALEIWIYLGEDGGIYSSYFQILKTYKKNEQWVQALQVVPQYLEAARRSNHLSLDYDIAEIFVENGQYEQAFIYFEEVLVLQRDPSSLELCVKYLSEWKDRCETKNQFMHLLSYYEKWIQIAEESFNKKFYSKPSGSTSHLYLDYFVTRYLQGQGRDWAWGFYGLFNCENDVEVPLWLEYFIKMTTAAHEIYQQYGTSQQIESADRRMWKAGRAVDVWKEGVAAKSSSDVLQAFKNSNHRHSRSPFPSAIERQMYDNIRTGAQNAMRTQADQKYSADCSARQWNRLTGRY